MTPEPLISAARIHSRCQQLGAALSRHYAGRQPLAVALLDGATWFAADLLRCCYLPHLRVHFMRAASYHGGTSSSGQVITSDLPDCHGADILLLDDILDSGHTLTRVREQLRTAGAAHIHSCVLLDKPAGRQVPFTADWVGFTVPNRFLVGYGLDYQGHWRHLPHICCLNPAPGTTDKHP